LLFRDGRRVVVERRLSRQGREGSVTHEVSCPLHFALRRRGRVGNDEKEALDSCHPKA